ncbi:hypothetical protein ACFSKL_07625 [Belliella marina]|uniref:Uncharacterized protein n=1 Tax=Belliella marina TaxID=1644146 RepID=A0ABW4VLN2_9BACT
MKKIIFSIVLFTMASYAMGQVAVSKLTVDGNSTLLDFYDQADNFRGIILPAVDVVPLTPVNGTFLFDRSDKKLKMYEGGVWVDLSGEGHDAGIITNNSLETGKKTVMGDTESAADGALVLESPDKAMILPHIANPHTTVKSPYPGMMCFDTVSNALAIFDGLVWNYWK